MHLRNYCCVFSFLAILEEALQENPLTDENVFEGSASFAHSCTGKCYDEPPTSLQYSCEEQVLWGKCNETWMKGYCCKSCIPDTCGSCAGKSFDERPPTSPHYSCQEQAQWGKCNRTWMKGYCCKTCNPGGRVTEFSGNSSNGGDGPGRRTCTGNCSDEQPPTALQYSCQEQAQWGKCNEPWMKGYCCKSCNPATCGRSSSAHPYIVIENLMASGKSKTNIVLIVFVIIICLLAIPGVIKSYKVWRDRKLISSLSDPERPIVSPDITLQDLLPSLQTFTSAVENHLYIDPKKYIKKELLTLELDKPLGEGCFGSVYQGLMKCDYQSDPLPVAVKKPKFSNVISHNEALIAELTIMSNIGSHVNLLQVYGTVAENLHLGELFVVFEICEKGSLLSYIKSKCFIDELTLDYQNADFDRSVSTLPEEAAHLCGNVGYPFSKTNVFTCNLLQYGYQIADGMDYISRYVVHRDLALRNMLLTNNHIVKIADFGLALDKVLNPKVFNANWLPIKWMAPEAICWKEFSMHSDVWSFGVVLWELFTLGHEPFEDYHIFNFHSMESFCNQLKSGKKLNCPPYSPQEIYTLMKECWSIDKDDRPSFEECRKIMGCYLSQKFPSASEILINLLKNSQPYVNVNQSQTRQTIPYENFKHLTNKKENVHINDNAED